MKKVFLVLKAKEGPDFRGWREHKTFDTRKQAFDAAKRLETEGYRVRIIQIER